MSKDVGTLRLWKLNERTGYWDYQRSVTPDTADAWRRKFQIDDPRATFVVSKNKPVPPALRQSLQRKREGRSDPAVVIAGSDRHRLLQMRALGVVWKPGRLPRYSSEMTRDQQAKADRLLDGMSQAFVDRMTAPPVRRR